MSGDAIGSYVADNPPVIGKQTGYFLQSGTLNALDLASSTVQWSFTGDGALVTSPILVNQYVFIGSSNGKLYAVDSATGQSVWSIDLHVPITGGANWGAIVPIGGLAAGDGLLVVPTGSTVTAYELSADP
jgi:outer membrane protein assembly factor BamB